MRNLALLLLVLAALGLASCTTPMTDEQAREADGWIEGEGSD